MGPPFLNGGNKTRPRRYRRWFFLQWGRRFSTAETNLLQGLVQLRGAPSMGPPFLNGGNLLSCELLDALELLQWGRRFSTAETAMILSAPPSSRSLQWGRRFSTAETRTRRGGGRGGGLPSMGPPFLNGGNTLGLSADAGAPNHLQWGRRFSTAETGRTASDRS